MLQISGFSKRNISKKIKVTIFSESDNTEGVVFSKTYEIDITNGIFIYNLTIKEIKLIKDNYKLRVIYKDKILNEIYFSVLPNINFKNLRDDVKKLENKVSQSTIYSALYYIKNLQFKLEKLKKYELSIKVTEKYKKIKKLIKAIKEKGSLKNFKRGVYRSAFKSKYDSTLRPYSIYIPDQYFSRKKYPLLVFLHGSGIDDRFLKNFLKLDERFILLAPNGRGTSNCYINEAQIDIDESIQNVINNFNIDENNIFISGFSMGGYGVYRTCYVMNTRTDLNQLQFYLVLQIWQKLLRKMQLIF